MPRRLKALMRGVCLGVDPSMALRRTGPILYYDGERESLIKDWKKVGGDMKNAVQEFESLEVVGRVASRS